MSTEVAENRHIAGRFQPGQSGNPGGRPKHDREMRELARDHGIEAVEKLIVVMRTAKATKDQLIAAMALLDRGFGKPREYHDHSGTIEYREIGDVDTEIKRLLEKLGLARDIDDASASGRTANIAESATCEAKD